MAKAIGYIVRHAMDYPDDRASYIPCKTRALVEDQLVDLGWMDNPGVFVYTYVAGGNAAAVIDELIESRDPYPDYVVERGPRGGVRWERA